MSPDEYAKKILAEIDGEHDLGMRKVLEILRTEPAVMNRAVAPVGYEKDLLASLSAKLPQLKLATRQPERRKSRLWIFSPSFSWSISGTLAVLVVILSIGYGRLKVIEVPTTSEADFLVVAASKAPTREIASWVASTGDSANQIRVAQNDLTVLMEEAERQGSPLLWEKIYDAISGKKI